jgi:opacity protein-like surface antigen
MRGVRRLGLAVAITSLALTLGPARPAAAEWFLDLYGGVSITDDADVELRGGQTINDTIEFDAEGTGGGRLGVWLPGLRWLGFAVDVSYFAPSGQGSTVETRLEVVPITGLVMFRLPLLDSPDFPNGRLQPYLAAGAGVFLTSVEVGEQNADWQAEVGFDGRAGIAFMFTPGFGTFVEGRYTAFSTNPGGQNTDFDIQTFHVLGGFTLRW